MKLAVLGVIITLCCFGQEQTNQGPTQIYGASGGGGGVGTVTSVTAGSCLTGGTITTSGTIALNGAVNAESATYQVLSADFSGCKTIVVASGTFNITLVASTSQPANGQSISVINYGSGTVTIVRSGQNINGGTSSIVLGPGSATNPSGAFVISDGTNYFASAGSAFPATSCTAPQMLTALAIGGAGTCTAPIMTQNSQSTAYTTVLGDAGKQLYHPGADTTARTWTIDSNANVAYILGTCLTFVNDVSAGTLTIAITSDTLVLFPGGTTGSRTLAAGNTATACKVGTTRWFIAGSSGLT